MGERYCQLIYGAALDEMPECPGPYEPGDEDNNWSNWVYDHPGVKVLVKDSGCSWDSSYESQPEVMGFVALGGGDGYETWELDGADTKEAIKQAQTAWHLFQELVKAETGLALPRGKTYLVFDHT